MKILVIGNGGREHALAWKIKQSSRVDRVFVAPGNAGTASDAENVDIPVDDVAGLLNSPAKTKSISPSSAPKRRSPSVWSMPFNKPVCESSVRRKLAAELETSKVFCKNLLRHADVATADYRVFRDAKAANHVPHRSRRHAGRRQSRWPGRRQRRLRLRQLANRRSKRSIASPFRRNSATPAIKSLLKSESTAKKPACWRSPTATRC